MKKAILLILLVFSNYWSFSQQYAYSFQGELSHDQQRNLIKKCESIKNVDWIKLKYKEDSSKGELIIQCVKQLERSEIEEGFSPIEIKKAFVSMGIEPKEFRKLND